MNLSNRILPLSVVLVSVYVSFSAYSEDSETSLFNVPLNQLIEINVSTASKRDENISNAPSIMSVVTSTEIERMNAFTLLEVLDHVSSIYMLDTYAWNGNITSVRGDAQSHYDVHTLILLNGRPLRESLFEGLGKPIYLAFPVQSIERLEIIRGPGSVLYGSGAFSGVINIITKTSENTENNVTVGAGSFGRKLLSVSGGKSFSKLTISGTAQRFKEHGAERKFTDESDTYSQGDTDNSNYSFTTHANYGHLTLDTLWVDMNHSRIGVIPTWPLQDNLTIQRAMTNLGWEREINDRVTLNADFTYNRFKLFDSQGREGDFNSDDYLLELSVRVKLHDKLAMLAGGIGNKKTGNAKLPFGSSQPDAIPPYNLFDTSVYLQFEYTPSSKVKFIVGAQANTPDDQRTDIVPRVSSILHFTEKFGAKLLYGEAFRNGSAVETNADHPVIAGNAALKPETVSTEEIQLFYKESQWDIAATYFHSSQKNLIIRVPDSDPNTAPFTYGNSDGKAVFEGVEFEARYIPSATFQFSSSIMYQTNRGRGIDDFTFMPNLLGKFAAHKTFADTGFDTTLFYRFIDDAHDVVSLSPSRADVNPKADEYHMIDMNFGADLNTIFSLKQGPDYRLNVSLKNLFDEDVHIPEFNRRNINTLPTGSGRAFYAFLNVKF